MVNYQAQGQAEEGMERLEVTDMDHMWEGLALGPNADSSLDLTLLPGEYLERAMQTSPTLYSSASDASLYGIQEGRGGVWRMYVPEADETMDDLFAEDMITGDVCMKQQSMAQAMGAGERMEEPMKIGEQGETTYGGDEADGNERQGVRTIDISAAARHTSTYKKDALAQLQLLGTSEDLPRTNKRRGRVATTLANSWSCCLILIV